MDLVGSGETVSENVYRKKTNLLILHYLWGCPENTGELLSLPLEDGNGTKGSMTPRLNMNKGGDCHGHYDIPNVLKNTCHTLSG